MINRNIVLKALAILAVLAAPLTVHAQSSVQEDFTGTTTTNPWWFFNGACLTASTLAGTEPAVSGGTITAQGQVPGCSTIASSYYNKSSGEVLVGGKNGVSGGATTTLPDPVNSGALRFTNGAPYGYSENGGIVSTTPFPTGQGVAVTFKTVTYRGDSGGAGGDGADGISFFLMDASKLNTTTITGVGNGDGNGLGAWGGSLGYSCSNSNPPYNGLTGGYVAVGIDEYGNFLNGTTNTLGETGTSASGDNTASGGGYQPGRIGMRGAGNVSWLTLNGAYGGATNPGAAKPFYPDSLATSCANAGGFYRSASKSCSSCSNGGTYNSGTNSCSTTSCATGTYNASANACESCSTGTYVPASNQCAVCPTNYIYNAGTGQCNRSGHPNQSPTLNTPTASATQASSLSTTGNPDSFYAVQNTCRNGLLYNYATANSPVSAGATTLSNAVNIGKSTATPPIAPILDYASIPNAYVVLPSTVKIANESAVKRPDATPIFYQLKISQNGLLSLSYSTCPPGSSSGCSAFTSVINKQDITTSNGPLPSNFLFGFAGSTGGSNNIHEILCFRADPATSAASSAGASEKQSAKLENGIQAYFAYYNPSNGWTGRVTASSLGFDGFGNVVIGSTPNWDASCLLTGVASGSTCSTTGQAGPITAQVPTNRTVLSWNGTTGVPFRYSNLSSTQQTAIDNGDSSIPGLVCSATAAYGTSDRVNFLRGDRSCEISSAGVGEFRRRTSVLADVMDSSPIWVGTPAAPYPASWRDRLNTSDPLSENGSGVTTYPQFASNNTQRTQVVYVGANDGLLHGFRSGFYNLANSACTAPSPPANCFTNNDGLELLAYMPASVVAGIHSTTAALDYSNAQYGHNYFVNATPGTGDLFYNNTWHTWLVSGIGAGGKSIFALDITSPGTTSTSGSSGGNFAEGSAASLVVGDWTNASITCVSNATCGNSLGNTFGTPQIRRLHDGNWGIIFGNGFGSQTGDAGIFVGVISPTSSGSAPPAVTFYYLSAGAGSAPNDGIAYVTPADLDGDHVTDYVYAGDLKGNVWRFDLTSATETSWAVTPGAVFATNSGQPITTAIVAASGAPSPGMTQQLMLLFGTGQKTGVTNTTGTTYAANGQSLYGVWDWNMTSWNSKSTVPYASQPTGTVGTLGSSNLTQQVVSLGTSGDIDMVTVATVCWAGGSACATNNKYGWFINLPGTQEQVVFNPGLVAQAFTVNTLVPAVNTPTSCTNTSDTGFTYVVQALTGGSFATVFLPPAQQGNSAVNNNPAYTDAHAVAMQTNATGSSFVTTNATGTAYLVYETNQVQTGGSGSNNLQGGTLGLNLPPNTTGHRLSWVELR